MTTPPLDVQFCNYCPHPTHGLGKCPVPKCRCKGKAKWWQQLVDGLGNAIGDDKFGG